MSDWDNPGRQEDLFDALDDAEAVRSDREDSVEAVIENTADERNFDAGRDVGTAVHSSETGSKTRPDRNKSERLEARRQRVRQDLDKPVPTIRPQVHELGAHLLFTEENHDLAEEDTSDLDDGQVVARHNRNAMMPFFAVVSQYEPDLPQTVEPFGFDGHAWRLRPPNVKGGTRFWTGSIAARGEDYEAFNEYQIGLKAGDAAGERKVAFQFRPSLPCATHCESGNPIQSMPRDLPYGVRVQVHSSNVHPDKIVPLLQRLCEEIGINPGYFGAERVHPDSRVYNLAQYVRVDRMYGERHLVSRGGFLDELATFGKQSGGRGEYKWNNEEVIGHRNAVTMDDFSWEKLLPGMEAGARAKYYHPKLVRSEGTSPDEDSLRDPKYELQFTPEYSEFDSVPWRDTDGYDKDDLLSDLDSALVNSLHWSGIPTSSGEPFTADEYFQAETDHRDVPIYDDPTDDLRDQEEDIALQSFAGSNASEKRKQVIAALTDGGDGQHVDDLAAQTGVSRTTVYRAVQSFNDVVEAVQGKVSFKDGILRERFEDLLSTFESASSWIQNQVQSLVEKDSRDLMETALGRWARNNMVSISEAGSGMLVKVHDGRPVDRLELTKLLRSGYEAARTEGFQTALQFVERSTIVWSDHEGERHESRGIIRTSNAWVSVNGQHVAPLR
jgi:AcrR family transcriptional regulator